MNYESEVVFDTRYEYISQEIEPLINGEYSNKFQELHTRIIMIPFRIYLNAEILRDIKWVLETKHLSVRTDKNLKEKIRKYLESNIMFAKGINEDVKECYRLAKILLNQMFIEDAKFRVI